MPLLNSSYRPPWYFRNGHLSTVHAGLLRKVSGVSQERERIELPDGDFLDLDWSYAPQKSREVAILLHGLEGHGQRHYILGKAKLFNRDGIDTCAVNFRGCSGEPNRKYRSYHSGATEDLASVVDHILSLDRYDAIYIAGVSLGGNLALKYLGEGRKIPDVVKAVVAVSVPCDLHDSLLQLMSPKNALYAKRFRKYLVNKLRAKQPEYPDRLSESILRDIRTLKDFDDLYTSKAHGFKDALDYYSQCSSAQFLVSIDRPALILNSLDDSFLGEKCYPFERAENSRHVFLETPRYGGHVGFTGPDNITYSESRALEFLRQKG